MPDVRVRGIRGATTTEANTREAILTATDELLREMIEANHICAEDVASVLFTTTSDLTADFPALAARALGWHDTALMCGHEMNVPHGLPLCIRILIHWNTAVRADEVQHVYIKGAAQLRPDRTLNLTGLVGQTAGSAAS
jgi:chorismate mutase